METVLIEKVRRLRRRIGILESWCMAEPKNHNVEVRQAALEEQQRSIVDQVSKLAEVVDRLEEKVNEGFGKISDSINRSIASVTATTNDAISRVSGEVLNASRTPWGTIYAGIAVLLTFCGMIVYLGSKGPLEEQDRMGLRLSKIEDVTANDLRLQLTDVPRLLADAENRGRRYQQIDDVTDRLERSDQMLQREMAQRDETLEAKMAEMQKRLELVTDVLVNARDRIFADSERIGRLEERKAP